MGWWIKSDGCDLVSGLMESVTHIWNGDVDMGDGLLQQQHAKYMEKRKSVNELILRGDRHCLHQRVCSFLSQLQEDMVFIDSGMIACSSLFMNSSHMGIL